MKKYTIFTLAILSAGFFVFMANGVSAQQINGECGTAAQVYPVERTTFLGSFCSTGNVLPIGGPNYPTPGQTVTWTCMGLNNGTNATCTARRLGSTGGGGSDEGGGGSNEPVGLYNPLGVTTVGELLKKLINAFIGIAYAVAAFFLLLSGFRFVTAQGNETKLGDAKKTFYYTIIGIVVIVGSQIIVDVLLSTLGKVTGSP